MCWRALCSLALISAALSPAALGQTVPATAPYKNTSLPFEQRVADLVSRMTLQEKAEQVQYAPRTNSRLNIPAVNWWTEALHGVSRAGTATVFPQAIAMASAWDPPLMLKVGDATADEARAKFNPTGVQYQGIMLWAPTINMARDPRWGRTEETYGEDPYLTGRLAVSIIKGMQGDDPKYLKTVATPKHFAMHSQETGRMNSSFNCPEAVLRDYYLPAFRDAFVEGKAASTMSAFNGINKIPAAANFWLLTDLLRKEWGFQGAVVTDWTEINQLVNGQRYVTTDEQAVAAALNAGVDVMSDQRNLSSFIVTAIQDKMLREDVLDRAVSRNLLLRFRLGMFDPPGMVPFTNIPPARAVGAPAHVALALKMAQESLVLLQNNPGPKGYGFDKPLLPLDLRRLDSIAVLGPYANTIQYGAYSGTPAGPSPTILAALRAAVGDRVIIRTESSNDAEYNLKAAQSSDVVIFVCGLNGSIDREGSDRSSVLLPSEQQNLLERVVKANPQTIVLIEGGNSIGLAWMKEHVPAIMMIWYPGEQGGNAVVQTLLGHINPSGHLPLTFYRANDDLPPLEDYDITKGRTYQYLQKPAPFVFGHGLSYTTFDYSHLQVTPTTASADATLTVTMDVKNSGPVDGDEVVQLYVHEIPPPPTATATTTAPATTRGTGVASGGSTPAGNGAGYGVGARRPLKQLKGFQRITIPHGETRTVTFQVPVQNLAFWDVSARKYITEPGTYEIQLGRSSDDIRAKTDITIK